MKKIITLAALIIILATACQKDEISPSKPIPKDKAISCRTCDGTWDLEDPNDTIPD